MKCLLGGQISFGFSLTNAITTIHHDKPESVTISTVNSTTASNSESTISIIAGDLNVTLTPAERNKRLLPYEKFYFNQPYNRPHQAGVSAQQYKDYEEKRPVNNRPEYESVSFRPKDILYQPGQKITPFSESNALPGHFRPMLTSNTNNIQNAQYVYLNSPLPQEDQFLPSKEKGLPDFGAIYEKLAQLKLRQQELQNKTPYGYRLVPHHRFRERPHKTQEYRPSFFGSPTRFKINPTKTTIEMFTATNIDIPDENEDEKYEFPPPRYHQMPTPTKEQLSGPVRSNYRENSKPFIRHQIAIEVPQSSVPLTFSPTVVIKPSNEKDRPRKPSIYIQQGKPDTKQPVLILRKPKPAVVVDENYRAEKFIPLLPSKYHHRPIYVSHDHQEPQYQPAPVYENFDTQYQATPASIDLNQQQYQTVVTLPNYDQVEYGAKLNPKPQNVKFVPVVTPSAAQYEDINEYYQYQSITPSSTTTAASIPEHNSIRVTQKLIPQYQQQPRYQDQEYVITSEATEVDAAGGNSNSLSEILKQLQDSNTLPQTLTPDNIDNSIKTLVKILNALRDRQKLNKPVVAETDYEYENEAGVDLGGDVFDTPDGGTPGKAGIDYPAMSTIPKTSFSCKTQRYKGFFGDPDTNCQVWHYCDLNGGQASFLCPNGTIFSQVALTCDWWYNVKCSSTAQLYVLNERLYKYIIPLSPKFPEDYSGPLVDKYLALKFQEMEEKLRKQKKGKGNIDSKESEDDSENSETEETEEEGNISKEESQTIQETERSTTEISEHIEVTTKSKK